MIIETRDTLASTDQLIAFEPRFADIETAIQNPDNKAAMADLKAISSELSAIKGASAIKSKLSKARRALKGKSPKRDKAMRLLAEAQELFHEDILWRQRAQKTLATALNEYDQLLSNSIGLRLQQRFTTDQAHAIASCQSVHRDISLNF